MGPEGFLGITSNTDRIVSDKVVELADEIWHDRTKRILKELEVIVQNGVAKGFGGG